MRIISPAFSNGGIILSKYTCDGLDVNPPLEISDVPSGTKSFVLIMDDPDAIKPAGKVWDHWIVFNIQPTTRIIAEGKEPLGIHGKGTSGNLKYHGPCPPDTKHRYYFKLYALDTTLSLDEGVSKKEVEDAMRDNVVEEAFLMGTYERVK